MSRLDARASKHRNRGTNAAQSLGRGRELCHNSEHTPGFAAVGGVRRLRIDELGDLGGLIHGYARTGGWFVVPVSRISRVARSANGEGRADRRVARCTVD